MIAPLLPTLLATLLAVLLAVCAPAHALDPAIRLRDYNHASWTSRDGAPAEIRGMAQTPDGWLWLGTTTGLFRFDGVRFERYEGASQGEVAKRRVTYLHAAGNGDLWISYSVGGLSVLHKNGKVDDVMPLDSPAGPVRTIAPDADGTLWIAGSKGLYRHAEGELRQLGPEQGLPRAAPNGVLLDQYQQLWALFPDGLYRLDRASGRFALIHAQANDGGLLQSPDGRLWLWDAEQLYPLPPDQILPAGGRVLPRAARFNPAESRVAAQFDQDGTLWSRRCPQRLCLVAGAGHHRAGALTPARDASDQLTPQQPISSVAINALLEDMEGNLWVATQGGLDRYRENSLIQVPLPPASGLFSMAGDTEGAVWLSDVTNRQTWRLAADGAPQLAPRHYQVLANDRDGALLLANRRSIERRYHGQVSQIALPPRPDGVVADLDVAGIVDDGKVLWVATLQTGLIGLLDGRWLPRSAFNMPPRIFLGTGGRRPGERWQATGDGTLVFNDNGKLTTYQGRQIGLATMVVANEDVLAGGDQGLAIFTGNGFHKLKASRPEVLNNISGMAISADGDRWFNGGQGVLHVRRAAWQAVRANPDTPLQYELLGALDGYTGQAMLENRLPSVYTGRDGHIWFMTSNGVLRLSPGSIRRNPVAPVPQVLSIDAGDSNYPAAAALRLPPGSQNFSIRFTAPGLGKPEAMRFQYQLSGINDGWQEAGGRRIAYYTNVAPGRYSFRVRAYNSDGVPSAELAQLQFEIAPTFVQTIWFKSWCGLALLLVLSLLYLYRLRIATRRVEERLLVRMAERERIARTLHDTFLQSVQALILRLDVVSHQLPPDARSRLAPILDQANHTIVEGRDQVYELRSGRVDDVESAAAEAGRQLAQEHPATAFSVAVVGSRRRLHDTVAQEACEIVREALRNAYRHAGAARVAARVIYRDEQFALQIDDDGQGMAADAAAKDKHYGLVGMRERALRAGGRLEIGAGPGGGLRVSFTVAARNAYALRRRWWQRWAQAWRQGWQARRRK